jgi:ATP-dependent helicase/nuclease subunit B
MVPSRFLLQLDAVLRAAGLSDDKNDALNPPEPWRAWAEALDKPERVEACSPPQPRPPVSVRPTKLSVTEIGTWQRNPYAIYAKHILKLEKLEELDAKLDAADRGMMIHAALEKFAHAYPKDLPSEAEEKLLEIGRGIFARDNSDPRVNAFWWANFTVIARWFIAEMRERHAQGVTFVEAEAKGRMLLDGLTLTGKADRIDRLPDSSLSIVDYKTGGVPTGPQVESGIEPQLQLLALIASKGGFKDIGAAPSAALEYWALKGGRTGCKISSFNKDIPKLIAEAEDGLKRLIAAFADPATPYEAVPKPSLQPRFDDYAHLARLQEWGRTAEDP